jgi:hypothetical protein
VTYWTGEGHWHDQRHNLAWTSISRRRHCRALFDRLMKTGAINAGMLSIRTRPVTWVPQQGIDAPDLEREILKPSRGSFTRSRDWFNPGGEK